MIWSNQNFHETKLLRSSSGSIQFDWKHKVLLSRIDDKNSITQSIDGKYVMVYDDFRVGWMKLENKKVWLLIQVIL